MAAISLDILDEALARYSNNPQVKFNVNFNITLANPTLSDKPGRVSSQAKPRRAPSAKVRVAKLKPSVGPTRELMTFSKGTVLDAHLKLLLLDLMKDDWLPAGTSEADFLSLFSGERSECNLTWTGRFGKGTLVYLFCELCAENLIRLAPGYTLAHVLEGHFVDTDGHQLTHLDRGDPFNEQAIPMVQEYISKMKISIGHMRHREEDESNAYGTGLDYNDSSSLRLHNRHGS